MTDKNKKTSRRRNLLKTIIVGGFALTQKQISATPKPKHRMRVRTREEVKYQDEPYLGRTCAKCMLYQGEGLCVILEDPVDPNGWCAQWVPGTVG